MPIPPRVRPYVPPYPIPKVPPHVPPTLPPGIWGRNPPLYPPAYGHPPVYGKDVPLEYRILNLDNPNNPRAIIESIVYHTLYTENIGNAVLELLLLDQRVRRNSDKKY